MRIDNHVHIGVDFQYYLRSWAPYCLDIPRFIIETENSNIDKFIIFPFASYAGMAIREFKEDYFLCPGDEKLVPYLFEHRRMMDEISKTHPDFAQKLIPFVMADPKRNAEGQVRSYEQLMKEHKFYGIKIQPTTTRSSILSLLEEGSCILDYAKENNLPLLIHSSIHPDDQWAQTKDILRVAEKRDDIRFALAHACCYHKESMDRVAQLPNTWMDSSAHVIRCQCSIIDYLGVASANERFETDYSNPNRVLQDMAESYPGKLIFGTDAPFYTCQHDKLQLQSTYKSEIAVLDSLSLELQEEISYTNTMAWLYGESFQQEREG